MEMVFSLCESMTYELALRHCYAASYTSSVGEEMQGLESLRELYPDWSEEDTKGMYTYLYVLKN